MYCNSSNLTTVPFSTQFNAFYENNHDGSNVMRNSASTTSNSTLDTLSPPVNTPAANQGFVTAAHAVPNGTQIIGEEFAISQQTLVDPNQKGKFKLTSI